MFKESAHTSQIQPLTQLKVNWNSYLLGDFDETDMGEGGQSMFMVNF